MAREVETCEREIAQKVEAEEERLRRDGGGGELEASVEQQQHPLDLEVSCSLPAWTFNLGRSAKWIEEYGPLYSVKGCFGVCLLRCHH